MSDLNGPAIEGWVQISYDEYGKLPDSKTASFIIDDYEVTRCYKRAPREFPRIHDDRIYLDRSALVDDPSVYIYAKALDTEGCQALLAHLPKLIEWLEDQNGE